MAFGRLLRDRFYRATNADHDKRVVEKHPPLSHSNWPHNARLSSVRLVGQWEASKNQDTASNDAVIADEFDSFWSAGARHVGKPTAERMATQAIAGYRLSEFRAVPLGAGAALMTYFSHITLPDGNVEHPMAVGSSG